MAQINKSYTQLSVPLQKMSFTPDVPSAALGSNEYNIGENIETDVRGVRSVLGEEEILSTVPGIPTYVTGGYRNSPYDITTPDEAHKFWFIVASDDGNWYANNGVTGWLNITPIAATGYTKVGYSQSVNITDSWNGTVPIFNDTLNAPFFWPDEPGAPKLVMYKSNIAPKGIDTITVATTTCTITIDSGTGTTPYTVPPFAAGDKILITNVNNFFNGIFTVVSSTTTTITYTAVPGGAYPGGSIGTVSAAYTWNYNPNWQSLTAGFVRLYSTPNVGNILVAGNLTAVTNRNLTADTNSGSSVLPCIGATSDLVGANVIGVGIPLATTVVSVVPGVSVTLDKNATATATAVLISFGLAVKERYPITIAWSQAFGLNASALTWEPTLLNVANQVEVPLRGEVLDGWPSNGQFFLNSYWDTVVLSPMNYTTTNTPILGIRLFNQGRGMLTANCWANTDSSVYGIDARDIWVFDGNNFSGIGNQRVKHWFFDQLDPLYVDRVYIECNTEKNQIEIYYPDQNAPAGGVPNKMISYRYDLDVWNPPRYVSKATYACESPVWSYDADTSTWGYNKASRGMVYAKGATGYKLIQKDQGFRFVDDQVINSTFRRDNIKLVKDYSSKVLVHRVLPEIVNLKADNIQINPSTNPELIGNVKFKIEGANSVGQAPLFQVSQALATNTDYPWVQINQNAHRVDSIEMTNDITTPDTVWMCTSLTFQIAEVEDDR
jgi:hypothetical protein